MWISTGLIIAAMAFGMSATNSSSLSNSLKTGKVTDGLHNAGLKVSVGESNKQQADFRVTRTIFIDFMDSARWRYLYFDIEDMDTDLLNCKLSFGNEADGKMSGSKYMLLKKGMNKLVLPGKKFKCISMEIVNPESCRFVIRNVQLREKEKNFPESRDYMAGVGVFAIYVAGTLCLYFLMRKKKIRVYVCVEVLQDIYCAIGNAFVWIPGKLPAAVRSRLRTALIIIWMAVMMTAGNMKKYWSGNCYKYNLVFCLCILFLITVLLIEKRLKRIKWNRQIVFCWFIVSFLMCVSEFFYMKRFLATGYINLLFLGFFYFVWNNSDNQKQFITEIMSALKILFVFSVVFSLLFRTYMKEQNYGYAGPAWNPNIFIMFLIPVLLVFLAEIIESVQGGKQWKAAGNILGTVVCVSFIRLCGSRIGELLLVLLILLFFVYLKKEVLNKGRLVRAVLIIAVSLGLCVPVYAAIEWGAIHLPTMIGHEVEFPADAMKVSEKEGELAVHAAEDTYCYERLVYNTKVTKVSAERNLFWMGYLREMNFLGHEYMPVFWGTFRLAHNGVLAFAYMYGVLIAVPYLFLYLNSLGLSFRKMILEKDDKGQLFFLFGVFITAFVFMAEENIEQRPFLVTIWILFYLLIGYLFPCGESGERVF